MAASTQKKNSKQVSDQKKGLLPSMTILQLKQMLKKLYGLDIPLQRLFYKHDGEVGFPDKLDDDSQTLSYYGVCDNGDILMEEIDIEFEKQEAQRKEQAWIANVAKQERDIEQKINLQRQKHNEWTRLARFEHQKSNLCRL